MLVTLPRVNITEDIYRFANLKKLPSFAEEKGLTMDEIAEVIAFDRDDVTKELMEGPFKRKPFFGNKFGPVTRFSNGEWPVFYAAICRTTAGEEIAYHQGREAAGDSAAPRAVHYSIVRCRFSGEIVDLRPKKDDWPNLVSDDYIICNGLGEEAHNGGLGGFFSPSARHAGGVTVPVFIATTLSDPVIEATASLTFDTGNTVVEFEELL